MPSLFGNTHGLKPSQLRRLERLFRRKVPPQDVIGPELARALCELSRELSRQIGLLIDRRGIVVAVVVGDEREIVIPDLSAFRLGKRGLKGLRLVHTHLKEEPVTQDDLTDLALLRLDLVVALSAQPDGLPGKISIAHLLPPNGEGRVAEILPPQRFHDLSLDAGAFIRALEEEMARSELGLHLNDPREKAILLSVSKASPAEQKERLDELADLARSADLLVVDTLYQRPKEINPKYLMGEGKIKEVIGRALQKGANLLVFDQNLSPLQVKAIGEVTEMKVIDRTQLILDIFAWRAHSREGKVQVELAQLRYRLPRLAERSTALSRLTGGIGGRGPGETRLEVDRRRAYDKIRRLQRELQALARGREQRRSKRAASGLPILSIVGYTNAGKSTLLNALTESEVATEERLFSTLDTSTRRLRFPREREVIITDTVGFIRDLPKELMEAFRSTLDELRDADLLLHLVDISNPRFEQQMGSVETILSELHLESIPRLTVFNKEDQVDPLLVKRICERYSAVSISALNPGTLHKLLAAIEERLWTEREGAYPRYDATDLGVSQTRTSTIGSP